MIVRPGFLRRVVMGLERSVWYADYVACNLTAVLKYGVKLCKAQRQPSPSGRLLPRLAWVWKPSASTNAEACYRSPTGRAAVFVATVTLTSRGCALSRQHRGSALRSKK